MNEPTFSKIIVAQNSPNNGCHASDGVILIVEPLQRVPIKAVVQHGFVSSDAKKAKSKYGWVKNVPLFAFDDFVKENCVDSSLTEDQKEHLKIMLSSIQNLPEGTPVTADYKSRGVTERRMQFTVHKVVFYAG